MLLNYKPTTRNPAAVQGTSLLHFRIEDQHNALLSADRAGPRTDKMEGHFYARDPALAQEVMDYTPMKLHIRGGRGTHSSVYYEKMPYDSVLRVAAKLHAAGIRSDDPLLYEQVEAAMTGRFLPEHEQAYQAFLVEADTLLHKVMALNLPVLGKHKGVRSVVIPRRARSLTAGASGVHIYPDPYDERYVHVQLIGMGEGEFRLVRDLAFEVFDRVHLRPHVRII